MNGISLPPPRTIKPHGLQDDKALLAMAIERIKELEKQVKASGADREKLSEGSGDEEGQRKSNQNGGEDEIVTPDGQRVSCFLFLMQAWLESECELCCSIIFQVLVISNNKNHSIFCFIPTPSH